MTRIAVISDSHNAEVHLEWFAQVCEREKPDMIFHLGDVLSDVRWLEKRLNTAVTSVAGNCDFYSRHAREARVTIEGRRILLTHGDVHGVKYTLDRLSYYAEENNMDVALFGHTHRCFAAYVGRALLINPGALKSGSYCMLTIDKGDVIPRMMDLDKEIQKGRIP